MLQLRNGVVVYVSVPGVCWSCLFPVMERRENGYVCPECGWDIPDTKPYKPPRAPSRWISLDELPEYLDYLG